MLSVWPKTILFGQEEASLENGGKMSFLKTKIAKGFWPSLKTGPNEASGGPLRPRFYPGPADHSLADARPAGIRHPAGLEDRFASQRNRLRRFPAGEAGETAGGRAPPRDRCGVSVAAGPLGPVSHGPAGNPAGTGASRRRLCVANGSAGPDDPGRSRHGGPAGRFCGVRKGDSAGTSSGRPGPRPPERPTLGPATHSSPPRRPSAKTPACRHQQIRNRPLLANRPDLRPSHPSVKLTLNQVRPDDLTHPSRKLTSDSGTAPRGTERSLHPSHPCVRARGRGRGA